MGRSESDICPTQTWRFLVGLLLPCTSAQSQGSSDSLLFLRLKNPWKPKTLPRNQLAQWLPLVLKFNTYFNHVWASLEESLDPLIQVASWFCKKSPLLASQATCVPTDTSLRIALAKALWIAVWEATPAGLSGSNDIIQVRSYMYLCFFSTLIL